MMAIVLPNHQFYCCCFYFFLTVPFFDSFSCVFPFPQPQPQTNNDDNADFYRNNVVSKSSCYWRSCSLQDGHHSTDRGSPFVDENDCYCCYEYRARGGWHGLDAGRPSRKLVSSTWASLYGLKKNSNGISYPWYARGITRTPGRPLRRPRHRKLPDEMVA